MVVAFAVVFGRRGGSRGLVGLLLAMVVVLVVGASVVVVRGGSVSTFFSVTTTFSVVVGEVVRLVEVAEVVVVAEVVFEVGGLGVVLEVWGFVEVEVELTVLE
jgi:hypothetical protein